MCDLQTTNHQEKICRVIIELVEENFLLYIVNKHQCTVADPGGGMTLPGPVKISHRQDGHQRRPYRFHVCHPLTWPLNPLLM